VSASRLAHLRVIAAQGFDGSTVGDACVAIEALPALLAVVAAAQQTVASFAAGEPDCQGLQEALAAAEAGR